MKVYLISIFCTIVAFQAVGQQKWSLEKCINFARDNNLTVEQARINASFARINHNQSRHNQYPFLGASSNVGWNFGRTIDPTTNAFLAETFFSNNYSLNYGVTLYNAKKLRNNIKSAELQEEAALEDVEQTKNEVAIQVATAFLNILFAEENLEISQAQYDLTAQQLDQMNKLISAGARAESEKLNLEAQLSRSEQTVIDAENNTSLAYLTLKQLLRLPPDEDMLIVRPEDISFNTDPDLISFDEAFTSAKSRLPQIKAAEIRKSSAEVDILIARADLIPSLTFGGNVGTAYSNRGIEPAGSSIQTFNQNVIINGIPTTIGFEQEVTNFVESPFFNQIDNNLSFGVGFNLNIPIYSNNTVRNSIDRARLNAINAKVSEEQVMDLIESDVQRALTDARGAKRELTASEKALESQKLAFENITKRLEIGAANAFEWESAKNQLETSEINQLIAKYDYLFRIKILEFYLGKPLKL